MLQSSARHPNIRYLTTVAKCYSFHYTSAPVKIIMLCKRKIRNICFRETTAYCSGSTYSARLFFLSRTKLLVLIVRTLSRKISRVLIITYSKKYVKLFRLERGEKNREKLCCSNATRPRRRYIPISLSIICV